MSASTQPATVSSSSPELASQLSAILTGAAVAPLTDRAFLRVSGPDATRWLNGMVTNNIQDLQPGRGNYSFLLNAQGRILGDCTVYRDPESDPPSFILETDISQIDAIHQHLDKFIIMDDVELANITDARHGLFIAGPSGAKIIAAIDLCTEELEPLELVHVTWHSASLDLIKAQGPLTPMFEIWSDAATMSILRDQFLGVGAVPVTPEALEALRILSGTPRYGVDIRNTEAAHDLPQETAQTRALHFSKGCYLGQEIVERIRSRGSVHRTFSGFQLTGALPAPGAQLTVQSLPRPVGELTSVAAIPLPSGPVQLALGYIRRDALDRNLPLEYHGGAAAPVSLPWPIS